MFWHWHWECSGTGAGNVLALVLGMLWHWHWECSGTGAGNVLKLALGMFWHLCPDARMFWHCCLGVWRNVGSNEGETALNRARGEEAAPDLSVLKLRNEAECTRRGVVQPFAAYHTAFVSVRL
jgi:hypothetical protein